MKKLAELLLEREEVSKIEIIQSLALTDHGSESLEPSASGRRSHAGTRSE